MAKVLLALLVAAARCEHDGLRMTVALYADPGPTWWRLARSARANPSVRITAIISPAHNNNDAPMAGDDIPKYLAHNATWLNGMATLRAAGVELQHYLHLRNLTCPRRGQCGAPGAPPSRSYCWLPDGTCVKKNRCCNSLDNVTAIINASLRYFPQDGIFLDNGPYAAGSHDSPYDTVDKVRAFELGIYAATQRGAPAAGRRVTSNGRARPAVPQVRLVRRPRRRDQHHRRDHREKPARVQGQPRRRAAQRDAQRHVRAVAAAAAVAMCGRLARAGSQLLS